MKMLYITSIEPYSGKTAVCLALGRQLLEAGYQVGYLKPVSTQPWRTPEGELADEDSVFVRKVLGIEPETSVESPLIVTGTVLRQHLRCEPSPEGFDADTLKRIQEAAVVAGKGKDLLLLEGGANLRQGYAIGLSNLHLAESFGAPALVIVRNRGSEMQLVDDALAAQFRLGDLLLGVLFNHVTEEASEFLEKCCRPFLQEKGVRVIGALPKKPRLQALSVGELHQVLEAQVLTETYDPEALVETFTVGAMTLDAALSRFRRQMNKAVITGGDRADIQLAALETSTVVLILTGNLIPSPLVVQQAESLGVPILLVPSNTMETVEMIERVYGKTRLGQPEKLEAFMRLMAENVDTQAIVAELGLS